MHFLTPSLFIVAYREFLLKCDVICETLPYGGTDTVILYQLFSHACDDIYG